MMAENPATKTPATFAASVSDGRWRNVRHIDLMDRYAMAAINGTGSKRLIITLPPRHGKSEYWSHYLPAWHVGRFPDKRVLLASYEAGFAEWWGGKARETLEAHCDLFGVKIRSDSHAKSRWEIAGHVGGMQTAGVGGAITGKGADVLIIDDPIKNAEEAASETMRKATWDWWTSTAYTRLEPDGIAVLIQTRWHDDDLAGRLIAESRAVDAEPWQVINLPAIAEGGGDVLGRLDGEPLWPERYSLDRLLKIKQAVGPRVWSALYQQRPAPASGLFFDPEWFGRVEAIPASCAYVRYWDIAGAKPGKGDWTVGCLMAKSPGPESEAKFYIADVMRFQKPPSERNRTIAAIAADDKHQYGRVPIWIERGIGLGKESTDSIIRMLAGYVVHDDSVGKDKETRAEPLKAQAEAGNVKVLTAPWNRALFDEMIPFPFGANDDQVDAVAGAFNKIAKPAKSFYVGVA
jgi:predicted phage terminase large subunit-like protein